MRNVFTAGLLVCLLSACSSPRPSIVGKWEARVTAEGVTADSTMMGSSLDLRLDNTFVGEIRNRELIVSTKGTYSVDQDVLALNGTQTLVRSAGKGVVGSSKPYSLRLQFGGDKLTHLSGQGPEGMEVVYERVD